jgi:alpha-1,2-mannosyltransferase
VTQSCSEFWLSPRRLRAHAIILAACLWSIYAWNLATPGLRDRAGNLKGTDFLHFYTLGSLAMEHRGQDVGVDLYDMNAQAALAAQRVPEAAGLRYLPLYPPQVSLFFAPLAYLPYASALAAWWSFSAAVYGICCLAVWRACRNLHSYGGTVLVSAIAYPAFVHLIAWGQTSAIALAVFTGLFFLLRAKHDFAAGLVLGCLIFKPQLGLAAAAMFLFVGAWKTIAGAVLSAAAQLAAGVFYYGTGPLRKWVSALTNVQHVMPSLEPKPYQTHSLRTFWSMIIPSTELALALYVMSAVAVITLAVLIWKRAPSLALRFSSLLFATVLVAPHLTVYDLVILAPAFLLLADWMVEIRMVEPRAAELMTTQSVNTPSTRWLGTLLYLVYALPLLGPLARWTHVQLSVIAMTATVYLLWIVTAKLSASSYNGSSPVAE